MSERIFTECEALTAMCIWEELELRDTGPFALRREAVGAAEFRNEALLLAPAFEEAYETVKNDFNEPFDWAFVPDMLSAMEHTVGISNPLHLETKDAIVFAKALVY
jgi:hypothetical protein